MSKGETLLSFILYRSLLLGRAKVREIVGRAVVILKETSMLALALALARS